MANMPIPLPMEGQEHDLKAANLPQEGDCSAEIVLDIGAYGLADRRIIRYSYWRSGPKGLEFITARHEAVLVAVTDAQLHSWLKAAIIRRAR